MADGELSLIGHYINRGYPVDQLLKLNPLEKQFFMAAWEIETETEVTVIHGKKQTG
ncbi:MAG: hypothetical protein MJ074_07570 [Oscillospiraceae bacterium]|nr:hypothetical protein [Oscillospiraceae bacterium]